MECKEFQKLIPDFIHKKMDYVTAKRFVAHFDQCPDCKEELNIQFLIDEGLIRLEEGSAFDLQKEMRDMLEAAEKKIHFHDRFITIGKVIETVSMLGIAAVVLTIILL